MRYETLEDIISEDIFDNEGDILDSTDDLIIDTLDKYIRWWGSNNYRSRNTNKKGEAK